MAEKQIWDDAIFRRVVRQEAKAQGMPLGQLLQEAGLSEYYLKKPADGEKILGRSTNAVLNIAEVLRISPVKFLGVPDLTPKLEKAMRQWREIESHIPPSLSHDGEDSAMEDDLRLQRVRITERIIATQLAALICVASDRADTDPAVLLQLIMHEINRSKNFARAAAQAEGGNPSGTKRRGAKRSSPSRVNQPPSSL